MTFKKEEKKKKDERKWIRRWREIEKKEKYGEKDEDDKYALVEKKV